MTDTLQPELQFDGRQPVEPDDVAELKRLLGLCGWMTRSQISEATGWSERQIRAVARAAGCDIVRGPRGFNLFAQANTDDIQHCANIAIAQGREMLDHGLALLKRLHGRIG